MTVKQNATSDRTYEQAIAARTDAARALHSAEIAVHDAHQTHVDEWISAANDRLHTAVARYLAADRLVARLRKRTPTAQSHRTATQPIRPQAHTRPAAVIAVANASYRVGHTHA